MCSVLQSKALKMHQLLFYINKYLTAWTKILIPSCFRPYHDRERSYVLSRFPKETCFSLLTSQYHKQMDQSCKPSHSIPFIPSLYVVTWMHSLSAGTLFSFRLCCGDKGKPPVPHWRWCLTREMTTASSIPHPPTDFLYNLTHIFWLLPHL